MTPARFSSAFARELDRLKSRAKAIWSFVRGSKPVLLLRYGRSRTIAVGVGTGLRFSAGPSNPRYEIGDNELPVQEALKTCLSPGNVFYDVGANVGFITIIAARLVGGSGQVYAFEPVTENAILLEQNVRRNRLRNVRVCRMAVSGKSGADRLMLAAYSGGSALSIAESPPDTIGERVVKTVSIDDVVASGFKPPNMIKIDVEGAEMQVLEGMAATLERYRPIVLFEIDGEVQATVEVKSRQSIDFLRGHGYDLKRLQESYPDASWKVEHYLGIPAR